jgi:glycosyltransferase involved in cell wall biosynthesis
MDMRIAQIAPLAEAVPPKLYGGTERVVSWLTEALVARGHEVTLFASADSSTAAHLEPIAPSGLRSAAKPDPLLAYAAMLSQVAERATDFDMLHFHIDWLHLPLCKQLSCRFLTTLHGRLDLPDLERSIEHFRDAAFVSISDSQRSPVPDLNWVGTVHHGLPRNLLRFTPTPTGYLAFLGRVCPEKGPDVAIRLARAAGMRLMIAAKIDQADQAYFDTQVRPLLGPDVEFVGEIGEAEKSDFLGNASALLFPICWPEPFGLVLIEAMACGTPVVAFEQGAVPEIIQDGVSGVIVACGEDAAAVRAIARALNLNRAGIRSAFERRFTAGRMADDYLALYRRMVAGMQVARDRRISPEAPISMTPLTRATNQPTRHDGSARRADAMLPEEQVILKPAGSPRAEFDDGMTIEDDAL